jgi:hypothetical protein
MEIIGYFLFFIALVAALMTFVVAIMALVDDDILEVREWAACAGVIIYLIFNIIYIGNQLSWGY